jgi:acetoin utilization deacetylase AcuC-like enzyme
MNVTRRISVVEDPRFLEHVAPEGHPEKPARLLAVAEVLSELESRSPETIERLSPVEGTDEQILLVHSLEHLKTVEATAARAPTHLDADTYVSSNSFAVARLAAGSITDLALRVARGDAPAGFAFLRPPGHHAESTHAMGFCLFNSVAIAARALQVEAGIEKIMIFDWDVHHGNGTQHSFEGDPSILYVSTHQFPFYPGTGSNSECGTGRGIGTTLNIPMPPGCGDFEYIGAMQRILVPAARQFDPDFILISCGFDAHHADPLGSMRVTGLGYRAMTQIMRELSDELCGGRIAFVLEGGYSPQGLKEGTAGVLTGMLEPESEPLPDAPVDVPEGSNLKAIVEAVADVHGDTIPAIRRR